MENNKVKLILFAAIGVSILRALLDVKGVRSNRKSVSEMNLDVDIALDQMLQQAVKDEDYELAATIRDTLAQRKIKSKEHIHVK